jgi:hypothetical protein
VPVQAKVVDPTGAPILTETFTVTLDPNNQLVIPQTFATSAAARLAFDFDLAASNTVDLTTSPPTVTVKPFWGASTSAADTKLIRVRGPLVNSSINVGTYSVVVRPFFDEINALGTLSIFNSPNTLYLLNGKNYVGAPGLQALSQTSAGSTMFAAFTTFEPTATLNPGINAGIFHSNYVIGGSSLEDFFTFGMEGDVVARNGNVLTLRGATLDANADQIVQFEDADSQVIVGPSTQVSTDGTTAFGPLDFRSIAVGQHIIARGIYSVSPTGVNTLDATGATAEDTGSVRMQSTEMYGSLTSSTPGNLLMNLQAINIWPPSAYNFAGNGATPAQDSVPANYSVNTGTLPLPNGPNGNPVGPGDPIWVDGFTSAFGSAPPDFLAQTVSAEPTVPATMIVTWSGTGTTAPFSTLTASGLTINLSNPSFGSGVIRIGEESIDMTTLAATPNIVSVAPIPPPSPGLPAVLLPMFSIGNTVLGMSSFNTLAAYVTQVNTTLATVPALKFTAGGVYNRATNIFTASTINVVL